MSNFEHVGELVAAREKIQNLQGRLDEAKADIDKWKLEFAVGVRPTERDGFELLVTATVGDRGCSWTIASQEVLSFKGDFETLSDTIAQKALQFLLKQQTEAELRPQFVRACANVVALSSKGSL